jgi:2-C-methyl-D-erythritol 2,4-cyclodiphosphate synthase
MFRIGHGYDVHRLVENRKLIIGGVEIPYDKGLLGHSDADVLLHAICDALLGAAALGDIGKHFPDTDEKYKNVDSRLLLKKVCELISEKGYRISNIDATVVMQKPKMSPFIENMKSNIAADCNVSIDCINIKATTEEKLGFTGDGSGVSAHAVCLIYSE